jgi:ABC-type Fe3+ transport system substrate-binding protein
MSPHRDEIREEVAQGFREWFQARCEVRAGDAQSSLRAWLEGGTPASAVATAFQQLFADWRGDDLPEVREAFRAWQRQPNRPDGQALLGALDRWREELQPVELVWQDIGGGTSQIARYIGSRFESSPEGVGIDVLFGGGTDIFLRFADQGLLEKVDLPAPLLARIRPQLNGVPLYDPNGRWYGPVLSSFGVLFNRDVLRRIGQSEPRTWEDLGQPGLRSWVSAGDPRLTGSVHMVYEIILQGHGWEDGFRLLLRLGANTHAFIRDSGTLSRTVNTGEVAAAGNLDANALTAVGRDPERMGFVLPAGETIINPDALAVLRGAPRPELARAFVEFNLSDAGQRLYMLRPGEPGGPRRHALCRLSVVEELYQRHPPASRSFGAANPFQVGNTIAYDSKLGTSRWDALNDLIGATIVDAHPDLAAAWKAVVECPLPGGERQRLERDLFAPLCAPEELTAHARSILEQGPRARTVTVNRWGEEARERYRRVRRAAEAGG